MNLQQRSLFERALEARARAYAPYSKFQVGAALITAQDVIYSACNVENAAYGLSICAEMNAITQMAAAGERHIKALLVIGGGPDTCFPCGACRQVILEFAKPDLPIYLCNTKGLCTTKTLGELLPFSFDATNLHSSPSNPTE